jgi:hypothetical protein
VGEEMSDDFIEQAKALRDENTHLREALRITSEALQAAKAIVDQLLGPQPLTEVNKQTEDEARAKNGSEPIVEPVPSPPQNTHYKVREIGGEEPEPSVYRVDSRQFIGD